MQIRSASDVVYTVIAWTPLLLLAVAGMYAVMLGIMHLELVTPGAELIVGNDQSSNTLLTGVGGNVPSDQEILDAIASGDVERMNAVYDRYERSQSAPH